MRKKKFGKRYQIVEKIASGGMATVYKGLDTLLERYIAIKIMDRDLMGDEVLIKRFEREAKAIAKLSHPNIIHVYDFGYERRQYYIVMELVEGGTLKKKIVDQGAFSINEVIRIGSQILDGLAVVHREGIVHRDLKPHNILVSSGGQYKITDFGIARMMQASSPLTHTGDLMGSVRYFSPEHALGRNVHFHSDIYSIGVILYEMLTGQVPFDGKDAYEVAMKHLKDSPLPPHYIKPYIPVEVSQVILRALDKNPSERYRSAEEMKQALLESMSDVMLINPNGLHAKPAKNQPTIRMDQKLNGRYQLLKYLGNSGMTKVYKGYDTLLDRYVALKVLELSSDQQENGMRRFIREAKIKAKISHPNVVQVHDVGKDDDLYYMVMEYIDGPSLEEVLQKRGFLPQEEAVHIGLQILDGLEQIHQNGVVHREMKPASILMDSDGRYKITDFSTAWMRSVSPPTQMQSDLEAAPYCSPEQARGDKISFQSDFYSFGVVLYRLVTGQLPFDGDHIHSILFKHLYEPVPHPKALNPHLSDSLCQVILKSLEKSPQDRYQSASEMKAHLSQALFF
ncbi:protein kinase domain-containing protein [Thermoflavimicrobium dichotomicum]|uniref:Serine/threonine-protein kinase PrkC n=1 Tax=Thermoflavimicrobium dichotomicum TaxID=46223 RepID=A0A1I3KHW8_9BACL|nr:protein kinase [Thermoflavimicrobium dichotomicum]SFI72072.1 Serine/threonine protein kinase [Thermoflavimicrobium dichotomicum]